MANKTILIGGVETSIKDIKVAILAQLPENSKDEVFTEMVKAVISVAGPKRQVVSKTSMLRDMFIEKVILTEDEIWKDFKWGKHETLSTCWALRGGKTQEKGNPEEYIYVSFIRVNETNQVDYPDYEIGSGLYVMVGQGPIAPEGYGVKKVKKVVETITSEDVGNVSEVVGADTEV